MNRTLLLPLLALAVGLGVGYLLGRSRAPEGRAVRRPVPTKSAEPAEHQAPEGLTEVLRDLPAPAVPVGTGTITGLVRTKDGRTLAGVVVRATLQRPGGGPPRSQAAPEDEPLETEVTRFIERMRWERVSRRETETGADGRYVLEGIIRGRGYSVAAYADGFWVYPLDRRAGWSARAGGTVDFTAHPVVSVPCDVRLPDGSQPDQAELFFRQGRSYSSTVWSPEQPVAGVSPGRYDVDAEVPGRPDLRSAPVAVELAEGEAHPTVLLQLGSQPGIRGTVTLREVIEARGLHVYCAPMAGGKPPPLSVLVQSEREQWLGEHNGYAFSFKNLKPGTYLVGVVVDRRALLASRAVDVVGRMEICDLEISELDPGLFLTMRVLGPDDAPVTDVRFRTGHRMENRSGSGGGTCLRRRDGSYLVLHHDAAEAGDVGVYSVEVTAARFGSRTVEYELGKADELEVRFGEPAHLDATLAGFEDYATAGKVSLVLREPGSRELRGGIAPEADGTVKLGPIVPGEYELVVVLTLQGRTTMPISSTRVSLRAGDNEVVVPPPQLYPLVVFVEGAKPKERLRLAPEGEGMFFPLRRRVDDQGRADFGRLPPGRYRVTRETSRHWMVVGLPGPSPVAFRKQVKAGR